MTIVVNLMGGPGTGKSTMAAAVFSQLKWSGVSAELVTEFAKDKVWEGSLRVLEDQVYILGKQFHRLHRLADQVDVIVTDSPLFLSLLYGGHWGDTFAALTVELFENYENMTYFLERAYPYEPKGRTQNAAEAKMLDKLLLELLDRYSLQYTTVPGVQESLKIIVADVLRRLNL